ncbi:coagulation factor XI-like [Salminus brasiliensis]|uniref:coagulation factor XI-like n=1 Tax=Salminus brasiliensis TaxID=930266 RepID=UPI003B839EA1
MGLCMLLLMLLTALPESFSKVSDFDWKVDVDFPGNDVQQIYSPDVYHCQLACTQHHSCRFFTFIRPDWDKDDRQFYCYLKNTASGYPSVVNNLKGVTSGFPLNRKEYTAHTCLSAQHKDVEFTGTDYRNMAVSSSNECQELCTSDPHCKFFSYFPEKFSDAEKRKKCFLKYSWTVPTPPTVGMKSEVWSGFSQSLVSKETSEEACKEQIYPHSDYFDSDFEQLLAASPQHCQFLCTLHPRCTHFSYLTFKHQTSNTWYHMRCFLKHKPDISSDELIKKMESYCGLPTRNCEHSNVWATTQYADVDFPGFDNHFVLLDDHNACQQQCTADPDCQFYTYVYSSFSDPVYRRRCYLKQVMTLPRPVKVVSNQSVISGFSLKSCKS